MNQYIPFNLNSNMKARITPHGEFVYKQDLIELMKGIDFNHTFPVADKEGWTTWTAWEFFNAFGKYIFNGGEKVCQPGILFVPGELCDGPVAVVGVGCTNIDRFRTDETGWYGGEYMINDYDHKGTLIVWLEEK